MTFSNTIKALVVGPAMSGKTWLISQLARLNLPAEESYRPTLEVLTSASVNIDDDKKAALAITELGAGLEVLYSLYSQMCNILLLVYDSTQCSSLTQAVELLEILELHVNPERTPILLVATKDEGQPSPTCEELSEITGFYPIFKVSSKLNTGIDSLRQEMVRAVKLTAKTGLSGYIQRKSSFKRVSEVKKANILTSIYQSSENEIISKINTCLQQTETTQKKARSKVIEGVSRQISNFSTSSRNFSPNNQNMPQTNLSTEKQLRREHIIKQTTPHEPTLEIPSFAIPEEQQVGNLEAVKEVVLKHVSRWRSRIGSQMQHSM